MAIFTIPEDIANVALQLLGVPRISTFSDTSAQAKETSFIYTKSRRSELRRFVWTFATRRAILRPVTATMKQITFPAWSNVTSYAVGDLVGNNSQVFDAIQANTGKTPDTSTGAGYWDCYGGPAYADNWSNATTYYPGDMVYVSTTVYRLAGIASSLNQNPVSGAPWTTPQGLTLGSLVSFRSPAGFDAPSGAVQRTAYPLPLNFLRIAPQDPKQPSTVRLGTTAGMPFNDWEIEGGVLYSAATTGGLVFRFVADTILVTGFDDMFCHALGARMAIDLNERFTQRPDLAQKAIGEYSRFIAEARAVSSIEMGSTEEDLLIGQPQQQPQPQGR